MLQKVQALDASTRPVTHPSAADRMKAVRTAIDSLPRRTQQAVTDTAEFQSVKSRLPEIFLH